MLPQNDKHIVVNTPEWKSRLGSYLKLRDAASTSGIINFHAAGRRFYFSFLNAKIIRAPNPKQIANSSSDLLCGRLQFTCP